jgi:hypothetical protein
VTDHKIQIRIADDPKSAFPKCQCLKLYNDNETSNNPNNPKPGDEHGAAVRQRVASGDTLTWCSDPSTSLTTKITFPYTTPGGGPPVSTAVIVPKGGGCSQPFTLVHVDTSNHFEPFKYNIELQNIIGFDQYLEDPQVIITDSDGPLQVLERLVQQHYVGTPVLLLLLALIVGYLAGRSLKKPVTSAP